MPFFVGMDEAGYGPNLGPLVVAATVWQVDDLRQRDLYAVLAEAVARDAAEAAATQRLAVADSKQLYQPQRGLADLERGVLASLATLDAMPTSFGALLAAVTNHVANHAANHAANHSANHSANHTAIRAANGQRRRPRATAARNPIPWLSRVDEPLPVAAVADDLAAAATRLDRSMRRKHCRLVDVRAAVVEPHTFNDLVDEHDGKGAALSETTLGLLSAILPDLPSEPVAVVCDKHGGRNHYVELLHGRFSDDLVEVRRESRAVSEYRCGPPQRRVEIAFRTGGEEFLPVALASMTAKYLRELSMRAFNAFWQAEVPQLRPTAGYAVDAKRFRRDIAATQHRLGIADRVLWRNR